MTRPRQPSPNVSPPNAKNCWALPRRWFRRSGTRQKSGVISLAVTPGKCGTDNAEGYALSIGRNVRVCANEPLGAIWATKTLLQMAEQSTALPCGSAVDYPAFPMRGFMLDVARKYFDLSYLEDLVKVLAYYKMNTFQVHLNDNGMQELFENDWTKTPSGFRIESKTFPGLASKDGHYTQEAFREFQKEALRQGVTIIPEIDTPAHTLSFSHYKPSLGSDIYGKDHMDLFNPEAMSSSTPSGANTSRATIPCSSAKRCTSAPTNTATRIRWWSNSSARSPTAISATSSRSARSRCSGAR